MSEPKNSGEGWLVCACIWLSHNLNKTPLCQTTAIRKPSQHQAWRLVIPCLIQGHHVYQHLSLGRMNRSSRLSLCYPQRTVGFVTTSPQITRSASPPSTIIPMHHNDKRKRSASLHFPSTRRLTSSPYPPQTPRSDQCRTRRPLPTHRYPEYNFVLCAIEDGSTVKHCLDFVDYVSKTCKILSLI